MKRSIVSTLLLFVVTIMTVACGSASTKKEEPAWLNETIPPLCGVGGAAIGPNRVASDKMAKNDARNEISKSLNTMVRGIYKAGENQSQDGETVNYEGIAQEAARHVHDNAVQFAQQIARWVEQENGKDKYVRFLFCLPSAKVREELKEQIDNNASIPEQKKEKMKKNTDELLNEADAIIEKIKNSN